MDVVNEWSWEENKLFEMALAVVEEDDPDRWEVVAAMVGGKRSAEDVHTHYMILLQDLEFIESGKLDYRFCDDDDDDDIAQPLNSTTQSICWTDEDHNLLLHLDIN